MTFLPGGGGECIVCDFEQNIFTRPKRAKQYAKLAVMYLPWLLRFNIKNRKCANMISELLENRDIHIVHTNNSTLIVGGDIARKMKVRHVWHFRGFMDLDFGWYPLKGWRNLKRKIARTDAVIGVTNAVLSHFISPDCDNAHIIYDAVRSKKDRCLVLPKNKFFLFCAARLCRTKGVELAIKAFGLSGLGKDGYRLRIVGSCEARYSSILKELATDYDVLGHIDFAGYSKDVKEHMQNATAFLMCSENEGLGRVTVESMFYGCLVIGKSSGGTKEIVKDGVTGYLFDDEAECASLMRKCAEKDNTAIIRKAQEYACSTFSQEDYGNKIQSVYDKVLHGDSKVGSH